MKCSKYRRFAMVFLIFLILFGSSVTAMAEEDYHLLQIDTKDNRIVAYIEGDTNIEQVECQIGMIPCEEIQIKNMSTDKFSFHTIVLIDNSLSITQENREKALEILKAYIQEKSDNEYISIATFGEDIQFLVEKSNDVQVLQSAIDNIQQNNQDTYLTDILYDLLDTLDAGEYTRFIVVSDGVDNKAIGITKEELMSKLKDNAHPIYTLGHIYKKNETELENMFALSRSTNGKEFLIDNIEDTASIVSELVDVQNLLRIEVVIPNELQDGSIGNILFTIRSSAGESEIRAQTSLPFSIMEPTAEPTATQSPTAEPTATPEPTEEPTMIPEVKVEKNDNNIIKIIAVIILIIVALVLLMINKKVKKKDIKESKKKSDKEQNLKEIQQLHNPDVTEYIAESDATVMLNDRRYLLILRDIKNSDRIFRYPLDGKVIIGRNVDKVNIAIDYNLTVSGQHCEIYVRNNRFFVKDLNSSNKTYLNGHIVESEIEVFSGSILRIGEVEFSIEIMPV